MSKTDTSSGKENGENLTRSGDMLNPSTNATLRDRCKEFYQTMQTNAILRQGSPVDDLAAFVVSETGRSASVLDRGLPLCLYFAEDAEREESLAFKQIGEMLWYQKHQEDIHDRYAS